MKPLTLLRRPALVLALGLLPLGLLSLSSCAPAIQQVVRPPTIEVQSINLTSVTLPTFTSSASVTATLVLRIQNPNALPLRLANFAGTFVLDGDPVASIGLPNLNIPARGESLQRTVVTVPLGLSSLALATRLVQGTAVTYRVDGRFTADLGLLGTPSFGPYTLSQGIIENRTLRP